MADFFVSMLVIEPCGRAHGTQRQGVLEAPAPGEGDGEGREGLSVVADDDGTLHGGHSELLPGMLEGKGGVDNPNGDNFRNRTCEFRQRKEIMHCLNTFAV